MKGVALGKTTMIVLPYETLDASRGVSNELNKELEIIENFISINGVPLCDYHKSTRVRQTPKQRLQRGVKKIIALQNLEREKLINFTGNIHQHRQERIYPSDLNQNVFINSDRKDSIEEQSLDLANRVPTL